MTAECVCRALRDSIIVELTQEHNEFARRLSWWEDEHLLLLTLLDEYSTQLKQ